MQFDWDDTLASTQRGYAMQLTAVYERVAQGYIGFVEELPGANIQAETLEEARELLLEAIALTLEANRLI